MIKCGPHPHTRKEAHYSTTILDLRKQSVLGSSMPKAVPQLSWIIQDPEVADQYLCGFAVQPQDGYMFKRVFVAVCQRETGHRDNYVLSGDVTLDGMIRMSDLKFIQKKER